MINDKNDKRTYSTGDFWSVHVRCAGGHLAAGSPYRTEHTCDAPGCDGDLSNGKLPTLCQLFDIRYNRTKRNTADRIADTTVTK